MAPYVTDVDARAALLHDRADQNRGTAVDRHQDTLSILGPLLRVTPELQDFCRFGGAWRASHDPAERGWAAFHVVINGHCLVERNGQPPVALEAGDVLLLPQGDGHVVYSGDTAPPRDMLRTDRDYIRVKQTQGADIDTQLLCGRLHLESASENLVLKTLPPAIVLKLGGDATCGQLVAIIGRELAGDRPGADLIVRDLASALFVMLLRAYFETDAPAAGLLALLGARETGGAAAAMMREPARDWSLDALASASAISRATLVRKFRKICGMPPLTFLTEIRLGLARNRMVQTTASLAQIAEDVGYHSEAALSRALQRRFAVRPGALRRGADPALTLQKL